MFILDPGSWILIFFYLGFRGKKLQILGPDPQQWLYCIIQKYDILQSLATDNLYEVRSKNDKKLKPFVKIQ